MELKLTNGTVQPVIEYLPKLILKGKSNRAKHKLLKKASARFKEFYSDMQEVKSDYSDDKKKQQEEISELIQEEIIIDMTEYKNLMKSLYDDLLDYPHELDTERIEGAASDSAIHDYLIDVLEVEIESGDVVPVADQPVNDTEADSENNNKVEVL